MKWLPYEVERPLQGLRFRMSRRLPDRSPSEIWPGIDSVPVRLLPFAGHFGNASQLELMVMCAVAKMTRPGTVFEFGTFDGLTTWHLAANAGPVPGACKWTWDSGPARCERVHRSISEAAGAGSLAASVGSLSEEDLSHSMQQVEVYGFERGQRFG